MKRYIGLAALLWMFALPCVLIAGGVANNPQAPNAGSVQGPDATGNSGWPISVVNATGTTLDVVLAGGNPTVNQGTPAAQVAANSWPVSLYATDSSSLLPNYLWCNDPGSASTEQRALSVRAYIVGPTNAGTIGRANINSLGDQTIDAGQKFLEVGSVPLLDVGNTLFDRQRTAAFFKTISTAAAGNTAVWTPAAGKKFRIMRWRYTVTDNATLAAPGVLTVSLFDAAAGATGQADDVYVPAIALVNNGQLASSPWIDLGNGYLSAAANNALNVNLSAALATGSVRVQVCGTEE